MTFADGQGYREPLFAQSILLRLILKIDNPCLSQYPRQNNVGEKRGFSGKVMSLITYGGGAIECH